LVARQLDASSPLSHPPPHEHICFPSQRTLFFSRLSRSAGTHWRERTQLVCWPPRLFLRRGSPKPVPLGGPLSLSASTRVVRAVSGNILFIWRGVPPSREESRPVPLRGFCSSSSSPSESSLFDSQLFSSTMVVMCGFCLHVLMMRVSSPPSPGPPPSSPRMGIS